MKCLGLAALLIGCGHPAGLGSDGGTGMDAVADAHGSGLDGNGGGGDDGGPGDGGLGDGGLGDGGFGDGGLGDGGLPGDGGPGDGGMPGDGGPGDGGDASVPACGLAVCARGFSSGTDAAALAVAIDSADNVYVAGLAESDLVFGTHTLYQVGARDAFVVSFAADGSYRWGKRWGHSTTLVGAYGIAVDASDNIYIVGGMTGAIDFGGGYVGSSGAFVASFDSQGAYRWARGDGGGSGFLGVTSADGAVYAIGRFLGTMTFSATTTLTSAGAEDVVVASFGTANGALAWARRIGTAATDTEGGIAAGSGTVTFTMSSGAIGTGERLVSWTSAGADRWSTPLSAALDLRGLSRDAGGNLYVSGLHRGGTDTVPGAPYVNGDNEYVHAFTDAGASRWSWTLPESPARTVNAIPLTPSAFDPSGNLVLAGTYDGTLYTGTAMLTSGKATPFLATFATDGTPLSSRRFDDASTTATQWVHGIAIDSAGTTYIVGQYFGAPNFGDGALPFASQGGVLVMRVAP